jgi:hypothetical protein
MKQRRPPGPDGIPIEESDDGRDASPLSAGQSGGSQGLSRQAGVASESIEELADSGQALEADAVAGIEDAADHPERPARTHSDYRRLIATLIEDDNKD